MTRNRTLWLAGGVVISNYLALQARADESPPTRQLHVNGVNPSYIEQGTGAPVVFVHGAFSDLRYWDPQRQAVAKRYRFIAYNLRYHGTDPWPDDGRNYSAATHADELAAFIRRLNAGPAHIVAISYGGLLAALVAAEHPEIVLSLALLEPSIGALLEDISEAKPLLDERVKAFGPIRAAVRAGDVLQATKRFFEWVNNQGAGGFDRQSETLRQMCLDNARTVPLLLAAPAPPAVSCATLGGVKAPTLVMGGAQTLRYFALINEVVVRCLPGSHLVTIPNATHPVSFQNPAAFNAALLHFLAQH
jgi:pimeloyl-ACP methyl ester carboxylesterase